MWKNEISNELDYQRALIYDKKLRILTKTNTEYKVLRNKIRNLIVNYESKYWSNINDINDQKILNSKNMEILANIEQKLYKSLPFL